ncbi:MAG: hypothetical protein GY950_07620 [bacterium]|nr:hypothetical protein [bacterium]
MPGSKLVGNWPCLFQFERERGDRQERKRRDRQKIRQLRGQNEGESDEAATTEEFSVVRQKKIVLVSGKLHTIYLDA